MTRRIALYAEQRCGDARTLVRREMNRPVEGWLAIAEPMNFQSKVDDQIDQRASIPHDICRDDFRFEPATKSISASNGLLLRQVSPIVQPLRHPNRLPITVGDAHCTWRIQTLSAYLRADASLARQETSMLCTDNTAPEFGSLSPPRVARRNAAVFSGRCALPIIAVGHAVINFFSGPWTARCKSVTQVTGLA